jgi:cytochrome c5
LSVRELDIDLIDRINPFSQAYAILSKAMTEERLKAVKAIIAASRVTMTIEEARMLTKRAKQWKDERGRAPSITSADAWEKRMAEGVAFLARAAKEGGNG